MKDYSHDILKDLNISKSELYNKESYVRNETIVKIFNSLSSQSIRSSYFQFFYSYFLEEKDITIKKTIIKNIGCYFQNQNNITIFISALKDKSPIIRSESLKYLIKHPDNIIDNKTIDEILYLSKFDLDLITRGLAMTAIKNISKELGLNFISCYRFEQQYLAYKNQILK